jgi:putative transposase
LEQRRVDWKRQRTTLSFGEQCRDLTVLRQEEETPLPAQAAQQMLKRVALAFEAFFRRLRQGQTPGYPRFNLVSQDPVLARWSIRVVWFCSLVLSDR